MQNNHASCETTKQTDTWWPNRKNTDDIGPKRHQRDKKTKQICNTTTNRHITTEWKCQTTEKLCNLSKKTQKKKKIDVNK